MMNIKPLGFYVLIEMETVRKHGLIELPQELINKEQDATSIGYVRAIGPTAYSGYPGCDEVKTVDNNNGGWDECNIPPHECWGLRIGQKIEYRKFEGKKSSLDGYENYRYIPDSHIIGAIADE